MAEGSQEFVIMTNAIKMNADIFANFLSPEINKAIYLSKFSSCLKIAVVTPVVKEGTRSEKDNYRSVLLAYCRVCQKCLKDAYLNKYLHFFTIFFQNINSV